MLWRFRAKFGHVFFAVHRRRCHANCTGSKVIEDMRQFYSVMALEYRLVP